MNYYICAFGTVIRWSDRVATPEDAMRNTFGITNRVSAVMVGPTLRNLERSTLSTYIDMLIRIHCAAYGHNPDEFNNAYKNRIIR